MLKITDSMRIKSDFLLILWCDIVFKLQNLNVCHYFEKKKKKKKVLI